MIKQAFVAVSLVALTACAAQPTRWVRTEPGDSDFGTDAARCEYEATAATQATDYSFRSGFVQELDRAMRQLNLQRLCMRAHGWSAQ